MQESKYKYRVLPADWHGKAASLLLYCMMLLHIFWAELPKALSLASSLICTAALLLSFILYAIRNTRELAGDGNGREG